MYMDHSPPYAQALRPCPTPMYHGHTLNPCHNPMPAARALCTSVTHPLRPCSTPIPYAHAHHYALRPCPTPMPLCDVCSTVGWVWLWLVGWPWFGW